MDSRNVTTPELGLIAATRAMFGAGIGLLVADRLSDEQRHAVGWTLIAVGALTTIPLAIEVFGRRETRAARAERAPRASSHELAAAYAGV